jgi:hypothetical protein
MLKLISVSVFLLSSLAYAAPCSLFFPESANPIESMVLNPKHLRANYRTSFFGSNPEIELYYKGKIFLSFASQVSTSNDIPTDFAREQFPNTRQAFENSFQKMKFKIWSFEQAETPIRLDFSKLETISLSKGKCSVNVGSVDAIFIENKVEPIVPALPPVKEPVVELTTPDRSTLQDKMGRPYLHIDAQPTR